MPIVESMVNYSSKTPAVLLIATVLFLVCTSLGAKTVMVLVQGGPGPGVESVPLVAIRSLSDLMESVVMDYCFDLGFIVTSAQPLLSTASQGLEPSTTTRASSLWAAEQSQADYLILIGVESGALAPNGSAPLRSVRFEIHPLANLSAARSRAIPLVPAEASSRGTLLSRTLGELFRGL